uniref:Reverse transcriptase domain-containing protein n=1 Tax=Sphaeramia orbicularis TaxID=375764 RepID=A0A672ZVZ7_9TELE
MRNNSSKFRKIKRPLYLPFNSFPSIDEIFRQSKPDGQISNTDKDIRETIREHCVNSYKKNDIDRSCTKTLLDSIRDSTPINCDSLKGEIKREEVVQAIHQLNVGKSPGPDGLPTEFYQLSIEEVLHLLTSMLNEGLNKGVMADSFYEGVLNLLYKKGDRSCIDNYRHLTLMNTDYKILAKIINNRLSSVLEKIIVKEQTCAVKGRYMWDNLSTLRELSYSGQKDFFIVGLDQKKAFDYISRDYLWAAMEAYGLPKSFIDMVKCLYMKSSVKINVNGVLTKSFQVERGVKQGCPLSSALYVLAISPLIKSINSDIKITGIPLGQSCLVKSIAYADDITVYRDICLCLYSSENFNKEFIKKKKKRERHGDNDRQEEEKKKHF